MERNWKQAALAATALALVWTAPASAQDSTSAYRTKLDRIELRMRALWGELDRFQPRARYCEPPWSPLKQPDEMLMTAWSQRAAALNAELTETRRSLEAFLADNPRLYAELVVNDVDPRSDAWWRHYTAERDHMNRELGAKRTALEKAPDGPCGTPPGSSVAAADDTVRPTYPNATQLVPIYENRTFCSELERLQYVIDNIDPAYLKAAEELEKAAQFRSAVEAAINADVQAGRPVSPELAALRREAADDYRDMSNVSSHVKRIRDNALAMPVIDCTARQQETSGIDQTARGYIVAQQQALDSIELKLRGIEEARLKGDCDAVKSLAERARNFIESSYDLPESDREAFLRRLEEILRRPCPPPAQSNSEDILGEITAPRDLLQEHGDEPPPPEAPTGPTGSIGIGFGQTNIPAAGIGFMRDGPPSDAPETFAGKSDRHVATTSLIAATVIGPFSLALVYGEGDSGSSFAIPEGGGIDSGVVYGARAPSGSSGIATPFGLDGASHVDFSQVLARGELDLFGSNQIAGAFLLPANRIFLYSQFDHVDRDYSATASISGAFGGEGGGFAFAADQDRRQRIDEDRISLGIGDAASVPLGGGVFLTGGASAGAYYRHSDLHSVEHDTSNFGPPDDRDFTVAIDDSDDGIGFEAKAGAALEFRVSPGVSLVAGGSAGYLSDVGAIFNPNSGDQVFVEGLKTHLRKRHASSWRAGAGIVVRFGGRRRSIRVPRR